MFAPRLLQTFAGYHTIGPSFWKVERLSFAQVLADDTNQDKTRAFIVVFKALRIYVADCVSDPKIPPVISMFFGYVAA